MGCGCGRNARGGRSSGVRGVGPRPIITPRNRSVQRGIPVSGKQLLQAQRTAAKPLSPEKDARRQMIEKKRRQIIGLRQMNQKKLNRNKNK
jgi:hypothetical protein